MKSHYARYEERGDLRVKIYVPRKLLDQIAPQISYRPENKDYRKHVTFAFQELVNLLILANERGEEVDIPKQMIENIILNNLFETEFLDPHKTGKKKKIRN
jgi:hypothetical protein